MADRGRLWRFSQGGIGADRTGVNKNQPKPNGFEQKNFRRKKDYEKSTFRSNGFCYGTGHGR